MLSILLWNESKTERARPIQKINQNNAWNVEKLELGLNESQNKKYSTYSPTLKILAGLEDQAERARTKCLHGSDSSKSLFRFQHKTYRAQPEADDLLCDFDASTQNWESATEQPQQEQTTSFKKPSWPPATPLILLRPHQYSPSRYKLQDRKAPEENHEPGSSAEACGVLPRVLLDAVDGGRAGQGSLWRESRAWFAVGRLHWWAVLQRAVRLHVAGVASARERPGGILARCSLQRDGVDTRGGRG